MNEGGEIPWTIKAGMAAVAGGSLAALGWAFADHWDVLAIVVVGGALVIGVLLLLFRLILRARDAKKAAGMTELVSSPRRNRELTDPEEIAKVADLTNKFQEGIKIYQAAGKNIYSLPWYLLVGEPGSGKTEMLRHSGVPTPLGDLPGVGGTINMNWWFTYQAVVLDTAGRIMFQQVEAGRTGEWKTFLELLAKVRPNCPVNGLMLVIPAESLIRDNQNKVEEKARKIARQFDLIQRTLDIRFPVFIVITKADLINGFRSFFDGVTITDAMQMLGWSNPSPKLDAPFDPDEVESHLARVRERLLKRRTGLLLNPVNTEDSQKRRTDQVDDLYGFPDAMMTISPRLSLYLQTIFVTSEWSPKPLFLRGIYFTSSMRQGASLDTDLAAALGVPIDALPEGRVWDEQKSFFLRDLFLKKIFPEKGLVTREVKADGLHWRRRAAVLATGFLAVVGLLGLTIFGQQQMERAILGPQDWWKSFAAGYALHAENAQRVAQNKELKPQPYWVLVQKDLANAGKYLYRADKRAYDADGKSVSLAAMHRQAVGDKPGDKGEVFRQLDVPLIFRASSIGEANLALQERREAYQAVVEQTLLIPLISSVREKLMSAPSPALDHPGMDAIRYEGEALRQLIRIEAMAEGANSLDEGDRRPIHLAPLFRYVLDDAEYKRFLADEAVLQKAIRLVYDDGQKFPPVDASSGQSLLGPKNVANKAITVGLARYEKFWKEFPKTPSLYRRSDSPSELLAKQLFLINTNDSAIDSYLKSQPASIEEYTKRVGKVTKLVLEIEQASAQADKLLLDPSLASLKPGNDASGKELPLTLKQLMLQEQQSYIAKTVKDAYKGLILEAQFFPKPDQAIVNERLLSNAQKSILSIRPEIDTITADVLDVSQVNYLWAKGETSPDPVYPKYVKAYRKTLDRLPDLSKPLDSSESGKSADQALFQSRTASASKIEEIKASLPDRAHPKAVLDLCQKIEILLVLPAQGYQIIAAAVGQMPKSKTDLESMVSRKSQAAGQSLQLAGVPMSGFKGGTVDPRYNPIGAEEPLTRYVGLISALKGGGAAAGAATPATQAAGVPGILLADSFKEKVAAAKTSTADYLAEYAAYWVGMTKAARRVEPATWAEFVASLPPTGEAANAPLNTLRTQSAKALKILVAAMAASEVPEAYQRELMAVSPSIIDADIQQQSSAVLARWRKLPADVGQAASAAESIGPASFFSDYIIPEGTLGGDYWAAVTNRGMAALVKSQADAKDRKAANLLDTYSRFPAVAPKPRVESLTLAQIKQGALDIDRFLKRVDQMNRVGVNAGSVPKGFADEFAKLYPSRPSPAEIGKLTRLLQILTVCSNPTGVVTVETVLRGDQEARMGAKREQIRPEQVVLIRLGESEVRLWSPDEAQKHPELPRQKIASWSYCYPKPPLAPSVLGTFRLSDDPNLGIRFENVENTVVEAQGASKLKDPIEVRGPWSALQLLREMNAIPDPDVPLKGDLCSVWLCELKRNGFPNPGMTTSIWIRLRFASPLPKDLVDPK